MSNPKKKSKGPKKKVEHDASTVEVMKSRMDQLKYLDQKAPVTRKKITEYGKATKKDSKKAESLRKEIEEKLARGWDSWLNMKNGLTEKTISVALDEIEASDVDVGDLRKSLESVSKKKATENNRSKALEGIINEIESRTEGLDHLLSVEGLPAYLRCLASYEEVTAENVDISQNRKYFKKLLKHIKKGDMKNILVFSNLLYTNIQTEMGDDVSKDRFKSIQDEIENLINTMEDFRKYGLEHESIEKEIEKLRKGVDRTNFSEARSTLNRINKNITRTEKEFFRRKGSVSLMDADDLVQEYGSLIDLSEQKEKLDTLREEVTTKPPKRFMEESQGILGEINDILFDNFKDQVDERFRLMDERLQGSDSIQGPEKQRLMELRGSILTAMENKNITEAMEYLSLAESQFGMAEQGITLESTRTRCMSLLDDFEGLVVENIEIENLNEQLASLESRFLSDEPDTGPILEEIVRGEELVNQRILEIRTNDFRRQREDILSVLDSIDMKTEKRSELIESLEEVEGMLSDIEEDGYREQMNSIRNLLNTEVSNYYRENYSDIVSNIQNSVSDLDLEEDRSKEIKERIDNAGVRYRERDYLGSGTLLMEVGREIEEMVHSKELKEAEDLINSAEFMFEEAERAGVNVKDQTNLLNTAKDLLKNGDIEGSKDLAMRVESSVKGRWMDSKREILRKDLDGLKDYFMESSQLGLDIDNARGLLDDAESFFDEERYEEVNERVYQAKESIEEKRKEFFSNGSMDAISNLKKEIEQLNELGLNTVEAETLLIDAEKLFMEEDYEASYSLSLEIMDHLNFTKETFMKEDVPRKMDELAKKVGKLEMMGLDTELARSYLDESTSNFDSGDLMETLEGLNKADEITNEIYRSHISLTIPETIVDVQKEIETAMEDGLEISGIQDLLAEAEEMFNEEDYDQALERIEKAKESFDNRKSEFFKGRYEENLDLVENIIGSSTGLGAELELSRDNINIARDAFERGDFEASYKLMDKIKKFLEQSMDDKETSKRREIVQTYYNEVRTLITVAEAENIDVTEETNLFRIAGDLLADGDFDQAEHVLEGIKVGLNDKRVQMKRRLIESSIQTTEILLQNMNEMGVDTSKENALVEQIKEALRVGDLELCDQINTRLQQSLHRNQGPYLVQKVQNEISELKGRMINLNAKGLNVSEARSMINHANDLFERGDLEGSERAVEEGRRMLDDLQMEHDSELFQNVLDEVNKALGDLEKMGIPTSDEEELIGMSRSFYQEGRVDEATSLLETALAGSSAKMNSFQSTTAEGYIQQIDSYLEEMRQSGVDVSDLEAIYKEGKELHEQGEDGKAVAKFSSILELGEELRDMKEIDNLRSSLKKHKMLYSDLLEVGMKKNKKISNTIEKIEIGLASDSPDREELTDSLEKLENQLQKKSIPLKGELVKKHISDARAGISEMKDEEVDIDVLKNRLKDAATLLREGKLDDADDAALSIIEEIERIGLEETEKLLKDEVASVKQMLTRLKTLGSNVSNPEKLLSKAETALLSGKVENAEKLIKNVRTSVKSIVKRNMRETAQETIEFVDAMLHYLIDNFSGVSSKLGPTENILDEARNLFREQKFKLARAKAEEARETIEKLDLPNINQFFYVFQSSQAKEMSRNVEIGISELQKKGSDTSKVKLLYDKAQEHFSSDEFDRGRQMITLAKIMLAEIDQQSAREKAFDELNGAHVEILTKKRKGSNVSAAYRIYDSAKEAFSMREYKKAILLAKKASFQVRKA